MTTHPLCAWVVPGNRLCGRRPVYLVRGARERRLCGGHARRAVKQDGEELVGRLAPRRSFGGL